MTAKEREVKRHLATLGITFKRTESDDYRVNAKGAPEAHAYYTTDLDDARATGEIIARNKVNGR